MTENYNLPAGAAQTINGHAVRYYVEEELAADAAESGKRPPGRRVIAGIDGCGDDVQDVLFGKWNVSIYNAAVPGAVRQRLRMNPDYRARATCAPEDTFDEETGKAIAYERLRKKYWERYSARLTRAGEWIAEIGAELARLAAKATEVSAAIEPLRVLEAHGTDAAPGQDAAGEEREEP